MKSEKRSACLRRYGQLVESYYQQGRRMPMLMDEFWELAFHAIGPSEVGRRPGIVNEIAASLLYTEAVVLEAQGK